MKPKRITIGKLRGGDRYLTLDLESATVSTSSRSDGYPMSVWHGVVREYPLPASGVTTRQLRRVVERIKPILQRVQDGSNVVLDSNCNWVGVLDEDATAAEDRLSQYVRDCDWREP